MIDKLIFETPHKYINGIASGELVRFGSIIKDSVTGKIVGHIQETGFSSFAQYGGGVLSPINTVSSVAANIQLSKLNEMVSLLTKLQLADLSLGVIGVGLSVANYRMMSQGFKDVQGRFDQLSELVKNEFASIKLFEMQKDQRKISESLLNASNAFESRTGKSEFRRIRDRVADCRCNIGYGIDSILKSDKSDQELLEGLIGSLLLANNCITYCLMIEDEMEYAQRESQRHSDEFKDLFLPITPASFARKQWLPNESFRSEKKNWKHKINGAQKFISNVRRTQELVDTKPIIINSLNRTGISGLDYLEQFESITDEPLVVLPAR